MPSGFIGEGSLTKCDESFVIVFFVVEHSWPAQQGLIAGTHDLLRVKLDHSTDIVDLNLAPTAMIPFVKEIVPIVDRAERRLGIEPPEGLLNIPAMIKNAGTPKKKKGQKQIQFQPVQTDAAQNIPAS